MNAHPQKLAQQKKKRGRKNSDSNLGQMHLIGEVRVMYPKQQREASKENSWHFPLLEGEAAS